MLKELYEAAELEVIEFANEDIVTTSLGDDLDDDELIPMPMPQK